MIVVDTNVVSEILRPAPDQGVLDWWLSRDSELFRITVITQTELMYGVERMPAGRRKSAVSRQVAAILDEDFAELILPFDPACGRECARILAARESAGRPMSRNDAMIAAICRAHAATLATRNIKDFRGCGVPLVDPWTGKTTRP